MTTTELADETTPKSVVRAGAPAPGARRRMAGRPRQRNAIAFLVRERECLREFEFAKGFAAFVQMQQAGVVCGSDALPVATISRHYPEPLSMRSP